MDEDSEVQVNRLLGELLTWGGLGLLLAGPMTVLLIGIVSAVVVPDDDGFGPAVAVVVLMLLLLAAGAGLIANQIDNRWGEPRS